MPYSRDANVRRSPCGVSAGSGACGQHVAQHRADLHLAPGPFVQPVDLDVARGEAVACWTDTASGYYAGKVPVVGGTLRTFVRSFTGQAQQVP
jgi:hypothetical protein